MEVLEGTQGPWTHLTERHRWLVWVVPSEEQLNVLVEFAREARRRFGIDGIYMDHYPITFDVITE